MRNMKSENNWEGDEYWTRIGHVVVHGDPQATPIPKDATNAEMEAIVQSWQKVAVLRVRPSKGIMVGFITEHGTHMRCLNEIIETQDEFFGMPISNSGTILFALPKNAKIDTTLELVEIVSKDDARYKTLPLY